MSITSNCLLAIEPHSLLDVRRLLVQGVRRGDPSSRQRTREYGGVLVGNNSGAIPASWGITPALTSVPASSLEPREAGLCRLAVGLKDARRAPSDSH
jgi:hypothetical protein